MADDLLPHCETDEHHASGSGAAVKVDLGACSRAAGMFSALGDSNRLRIVIMLSGGEMCVSEITAALGDNLSAVSQRLKLLRSERMVKTRREGKHVYYALADLHVAELVRNALDHAAESH
jgi:ArsR family transcriptional regulator, lead/cadmium/zinc/bismuth-responsive transcriptional repressor